jgi:serine/threonine-protein kinase
VDPSSDANTRLGSVASPPLRADEFTPGTILADRYRIVALLGRGGMGEVYRAEDLRLGQSVALKFLPELLADDPLARNLLVAEARHARDVAHPNVCRVYDIGELDGPSVSAQLTSSDSGRAAAGPRRGRMFLTMEYIDGEDLATLLRRIGKLPPAKALEIAHQLCAGLAAAHDRGLLHRDLKPSNVMIDGRGHARITDFGLAVKRTDDHTPGDFAGTPAYMAPERLHGAQATAQSDLYALGLILYETFTGQPALKADTPEDWRQAHASSTPRRPSLLSRDVEPAVERVILQCLEKEPERRPRSAAHAGAMLPGGDPLAAAVAAGETPSPEMVAAAGAEGTLPRRAAWGLLVACLASLVAVVAIFGWVELPALVRFKGSPEVLRANARDLLGSLGYQEAPADSAWWFSVDWAYRRHLVALTPARRRFDDLAQTRPGPLVFHYRQAPRRLVPLDSSGTVSTFDPAPGEPGDALVETDTLGRLTALQVVPPDRDAAAPGGTAPDWKTLFDAAGLDRAAFSEARPEWVPPVHADARVAWSGVLNGERVRIEAAAWQGRPVFFKVLGPWNATQQAQAVWTTLTITRFITPVLWMITVVVLAFFSLRNLRMGRGDRKGGLRVAVFILGTLVVMVVIRRHWSFSPAILWDIVSRQFGLPLFMALTAWLYYIGFEPFVRRRWPHMLIGWARLLDGRLRDPLVGRAILAGVLGGAAVAALSVMPEVLGRMLDLPRTFPYVAAESLNATNRFAAVLLRAVADGVTRSFGLMAVVLVARLLFRSDRAALAAAFVTSIVIALPGGENWALELAVAVPTGAMVIVLLQRFGMLAICVLLITFDLLVWSPLTLDPTKWFVWRSAAAFALPAGLAVRGFLNVLGRQSAFPRGVFDQ